MFPRRPLGVALAADVAAAWGGGRCARVLCLFEPGPLIPFDPTVRWETVLDEPGAVLAALDREPGTPSLVLLGPDTSRESEAALESRVDGLIVPVQPGSGGVARTLGEFRRRRHWSRRFAVLSPGRGERPGEPFRMLEAAARRQLGVRIEDFGAIDSDADFARSLLGTPVHELREDEPYRRTLRQLSGRL